MKAFIEEYGQFLVSVLIGVVLLGVLFATTIENSRIMSRLVPDERNMALQFLKNTDVVDSKKIPQMDIVDSVVVLINPNTQVTIDYMSPTIVHKVTDGQGGNVTTTNYVPMKYARQESKLKKGYLNIIGYDAVNAQVKGDYTVTYQYENPETGYKNVHDMIICVRRPYIPHEYIQATGTQYLDTGIVPSGNATSVVISYKPDSVSGRQDIIWTTGSRMKFGIFISNGKWGYAYGNNEVVTNITATTGRQEVRLDALTNQFVVNGTAIDIPTLDSVGDGYIQIFKSGQSFGRLYSVDIYENKKLRRSMFPAYSKTTNAMGMWDTVTWSAFNNTSATQYPPLKYGPEIDE